MKIEDLPYGSQTYLADKFGYSRSQMGNILHKNNKEKYPEVFEEVEKLIKKGYLSRNDRYAIKNKKLIESLTNNQYKILLNLAIGKNCKEISFELNLSASTIHAHLTKLKNSFDVYSNEALISKYMDCVSSENLKNIIEIELKKLD